MGMMEDWFRMIAQQPRIGGIPVAYMDGCYPASGGTRESYMSSPDFFITGPLDTGFSGAKSVTYTQFSDKTPSNGNVCLREFNDITGVCRDYWGQTSAAEGARTATISGRYIYACIPKAKAANQYMYYTVDGVRHYLYKGSNVTD